jgi:putative endonuclease
MQFYYAYVLQEIVSKSLYIGFTADLRKRIKGHNSGDTKTTKKGNYKLIYYESYLNKADALGREKFLKGGSGRKYLNKQLAHYFKENV